MASVKLVVLLLLMVALLYVIYRASDYYFTKKERDDRLETRKEIWREARAAGIWADDDPESFDQTEYERAAQELGMETEDL